MILGIERSGLQRKNIQFLLRTLSMSMICTNLWSKGHMQKKIEKGSPEWTMFREFWSLRQKFHDPENTDEFWDAAIKEVSTFAGRYKEAGLYDFALQIGMAILDDAERRKRG